jgi:hypothetical protein
VNVLSSLVTYCVVLKGSIPWSSFCFLIFLFSEGFFLLLVWCLWFPYVFKVKSFSSH